MKALFQLQWSLHKRILLPITIIISLFSYFFYDTSTEMSLVTFALVFSMSSVEMSMRILTDQRMQYTLYAMPLARETIIKSVYMTALVICTIIFLLILPMQLYIALTQHNLHRYLITFFGLYGTSLLGISLHFPYHLNREQLGPSWLEWFLSFISAMVLIFIPHLLLTGITHEPTFWLRLFTMPTVSILLYIYRMQKGIKKFAHRELL